MQRLNLFFNHCVGESKSICSDKRRRGRRRHIIRSNSYRAEIMNTLLLDIVKIRGRSRPNFFWPLGLKI